jgi:hypothetical protein
MQALIETERVPIADDKDLLAMDEHMPTCNKRFASDALSDTSSVRLQAIERWENEGGEIPQPAQTKAADLSTHEQRAKA